ncbi:MAG: hypothetical protein KVP17_004993 [Porospora cf. gigantea B]|nr:MAG: hypothetical protein KVP17_004993 [Porospora cf. gigantea B]
MLSTLYVQAQRSQQEVEKLLSVLNEKARVVTSEDQNLTPSEQQRLLMSANLFTQHVGQLANEFDRVKGTLNQRQVPLWEHRLRQFSNDDYHFRSAVERQLGLVVARESDARRRQLLGTHEQQERMKDTVGASIQERARLEETMQSVSNLLQQGQASVANLVNQNAVLKGAQKKALDIRSSVASASSLVNVISRRLREDVWLVVSLSLLTLAVTGVAYFFMRAGPAGVSQ